MAGNRARISDTSTRKKRNIVTESVTKSPEGTDASALVLQIADAVAERMKAEGHGMGTGGGGDVMVAIETLFKELEKARQDIKKLASQTRATYTPPAQGNIAPLRNMSDDGLLDSIVDVELTEEQRAERGAQATRNFITALQGMASNSTSDAAPKGPRRMDVPQFGPPEIDIDELV
jgi:hypothetical protein